MALCNHLCTGYYYGCNFRTYDGYCTFSEHIKPIEQENKEDKEDNTIHQN